MQKVFINLFFGFPINQSCSPFTRLPPTALYYMFYSGLKEHLTGPNRPQAVVNFSSGVAAAVAATILTQPADVVRTRMQVRFFLAVLSSGYCQWIDPLKLLTVRSFI